MRPPYRHIVRQNEASAINVWDKPLNSSKYQITIKKHDVNHASDILSARDAKATVQPKRQTLVKTPRRQDLVVTPADCLRDHPQRAELSKECNLRVPSISVARLLKHSLAKSGLVLSIDTDMLWEGTYARRIQTPISASIQKLPDDAERKSSWPMIVQGKTEEDRQPYLYISANPSSNEIAEQRDEINVAFWLGILTTDELIRNGGLAAQNQVARQTRHKDIIIRT
jgi:hypothetical protein